MTNFSVQTDPMEKHLWTFWNLCWPVFWTPWGTILLWSFLPIDQPLCFWKCRSATTTRFLLSHAQVATYCHQTWAGFTKLKKLPPSKHADLQLWLGFLFPGNFQAQQNFVFWQQKLIFFPKREVSGNRRCYLCWNCRFAAATQGPFPWNY